MARRINAEHKSATSPTMPDSQPRNARLRCRLLKTIGEEIFLSRRRPARAGLLAIIIDCHGANSVFK